MPKHLNIVCLAALLVAAALSLGSCAGQGSNSNNSTDQLLSITDTASGGSTVDLNLRGPLSAGSFPLTFYVFGSDTSLGDHVDIPLGPQRKAEASFGPYAPGEHADHVDLSPWAAYAHVYLRCNPALPQYIFELKAGHTYTFSSN